MTAQHVKIAYLLSNFKELLACERAAEKNNIDINANSIVVIEKIKANITKQKLVLITRRQPRSGKKDE